MHSDPLSRRRAPIGSTLRVGELIERHAVQQTTTIDALALSAEVELAEQCDRAGAHEDAVKHLVAGTRNQDVEATTRLGKRLLVGDRAPRLPNEGAGFLGDASKLGGAEAAALLAVLYGVGANTTHDLKSALDSLIVAAERGWQPAQAQLAVLAAEQSAGRAAEHRNAPHAPHTLDHVGAPNRAAQAAAAATDWRRLAARIDLAAWQSAPPAVDVNTDPLIRSYPNFVSAPVARWLIDKARGRLTRALVYEALIKKVTVHHTRTNTATMFNLLETDLVCVLLQNRMCACLGTPFRHLEAMTVLHYDEGEEITDHFDFIDPNVPDYSQEIRLKGQRIVTFLVYLNDDYGGGETEFPRLAVSHKGERGEGLFFVNSLRDGSADLRTLHAGRPPSRGDKWIVSQFVRDRPTF
jgi:prolyl 4-hydroxylase